jgi:hypothetical protein
MRGRASRLYPVLEGKFRRRLLLLPHPLARVALTGLSGAASVVFQLNDVNQYLTIRPDEGIFFLLVPFDRGGGRRAGF